VFEPSHQRFAPAISSIETPDSPKIEHVHPLHLKPLSYKREKDAGTARFKNGPCRTVSKLGQNAGRGVTPLILLERAKGFET